MLKHQWYWMLLITLLVHFGTNQQYAFCQSQRQPDSLPQKKAWMVMFGAVALDNQYVYYGLPLLIYQSNQHGLVTGAILIPTDQNPVRPGLTSGYFFITDLRKKLVAVTLETFVTVLPYVPYGFISVTGGFGLRINLTKRLILHHFIGMGGRHNFDVPSDVRGVAQLRLGIGCFISRKRKHEG